MSTTTPWREGRWQRPFFVIWTGQALSLVGSSIAGFALIWWLTVETGSATILALVTVFAQLPQILLGPLAGTLVDRWNRRRIMLAADSLIALATLGLAYLFASGQIQVWHLFAIMVIRSLGGTFHFPAMQSSTSLMVPEEQLARVAGLNQLIQGAQGILAPPLGALLLAILPIERILLIDVATAAFAVLPLLFILLPEPVRTVRQDAAGQTVRTSVWQEMVAGFRYIWRWPGLRVLIGVALIANFLFTPVMSLLPIVVTNHFGGEAGSLALLEALWSVGIVLGGLALAVWGGFKRKMNTSLLGLGGMAFGPLLIGVAPPNLFILAAAAMLIGGFFNPIANGPIFAVMQSTVAPDMQGRVFGLIGALAPAIAPLGLVVAGPITDLVGIQWWYLIAGIGFLAVTLVVASNKTLMDIEHNRQRSTQEQAAQEALADEGPAAAPDVAAEASQA